MTAPEESQSSDGDAALLAACRAGDQHAFDRLVLRHQRRAYALALRMMGNASEAADVTQEAFIRAYRGLGGFREQAKFSTWLYAILLNCCRNRRRWWARHRRVVAASLDAPKMLDDGQVLQEPEDPDPGPADMAMRSELSEQLSAALLQLDHAHREVLVLRDVQGLSYEEIAAVLACELGTVKSRLSRARWRLRALLDGTL